MKERVNHRAVCPRCGATYNGRPAISRRDNTTAICPDCGTREALSALGVDIEEQEQIILAIHRCCREGIGNAE